MIKYLALVAFFSLGCVQKRQVAIDLGITRITLNHEDNLRIPFHWIRVTIEKRMDSIIVHSISKPSEDSMKWEYSRIDTSFAISSASYNKLISLVSQISAEDLKSSRAIVDDGTSVTISYGNSKSEQTFDVSTPAYDAERRKTKHFFEADMEILKISRIPFE